MAGTTGTKSALFVERQAGGNFSIVDESQTQGNKWFVDSNAVDGQDADGYGQNPNSACLTTEYCITNFANPGDTIFVLPGHNEDSDAVLFDADVVGLRIIGIGDGTRRPRYDFNNAASTVDVGANSVMLKNLTFLASAPSVLIGVDIETDVTDTIIENCEWLDAETAGDEFVVGVDLKGGNHQTVVKDCIMRTEVAAGASTTAINIAAACNRVRITNNIINGNFSTGGIVEAAAGDAYYIAHNTIKVGDGLPGITLQATATGHIRHNLIESTGLAVDAQIVAAACALYDNKGVDVDGTQCQIIGLSPEEAPEDGALGAGLNLYVDSEHGANTNTATSWSDALDTIDAAIALCTHDHGDVIHLAPFHNELVGVATPNVDIRGVTIKSGGEGWMAATMNFDGNTDTFQIDAAGTVIDGIHFIGGVADLAVALDITGNGDGSHIRNCEFVDLAAGAEMLVGIGVAVNADRITIEDNVFRTTNGGDATDAILFVGESVRTIVRRNLFFGDWSSSCVDGSAAAQEDVTIADNVMYNVDAVVACIVMNAATTGTCTGNKVHGGAQIDLIDAPAMFKADNIQAQHEGVEVLSDLGIEVVRGTGVVPQTATLALFTVAGGDVLVTAIVGQVDTNNFGAVANATSIDAVPTTGQASILCATLDLTGTTIGTHLSISGVPTDTLQKHGMVMATGVIAQIGSISMTCGGNEANATQVQWTLWYKPITAGATVVAA